MDERSERRRCSAVWQRDDKDATSALSSERREEKNNKTVSQSVMVIEGQCTLRKNMNCGCC